MRGKPSKRIRVFHWRPEESGPLIAICQANGFEVEYAPGPFPAVARAIRQSPPDAIVINLSRLPSHGRETAIAVRHARYSRYIPLLFVGGVPEKVEAIRRQLPDVPYTSLGEQANEAGLVDYKICALGQTWSGMLFAAKKS